MLRRIFLKAIVGLSYGIPQEFYREPKLPKVLIIGDSISMGYTKYVQDILKGKAYVQRPTNSKGQSINCQGTIYGVKHIDEWISKIKWDIIHFNFGLHDLKHIDPVTGNNSQNPDHPQQANIKTYRKNLTEITKKLIKTKAKLIFATTTPFPEQPSGPFRSADQPEKYNKVALEIMKQYEISINDLYAFALPRLEELQKPQNVHFTIQGSKVLAKKVVDTIKTMMQY